MTLEQQCASLELSKKLKELGYPQEGLFIYRKNTGMALGPTFKDNITRYELTEKSVSTSHDDFIVAPTVAELGEWLPFASLIEKSTNGEEDRFIVFLRETRKVFIEGSQAAALARGIVWLVENKYISFTKKV